MAVFTRLGFEAYKQLVRAQEERVRSIGLEVGEEAGPSCDWHDNFGFEDARRRLEQEGARLKEMHTIIKSAQVVELEDQSQSVRIGNTVTANIDGNLRVFTIGGFGEANASANIVSYDSPIAKLVMGCKKGELREAVFQGKEIDVEIVDISPPSMEKNNASAV